MKIREILLENETTLYHVTLTKNVPKIIKSGILMLQTSNWVQSGSKERYGDGSIFAFSHKKDAVLWAAKWDWEVSKSMGSGKVSIVEFTDDMSTWIKDDADPLGQAGKNGDWLKKKGAVKPDKIKSDYPVTLDMIKQLNK